MLDDGRQMKGCSPLQQPGLSHGACGQRRYFRLVLSEARTSPSDPYLHRISYTFTLGSCLDNAMDLSPPEPNGQITPAESSSPATSVQRPTRSRKGCFSCRRRIVKCDENPPQCRNCKIGDRQVSLENIKGLGMMLIKVSLASSG